MTVHACSCGSIISGQRRPRVTRMAFSVETWSRGRPSAFHCRISYGSASTLTIVIDAVTVTARHSSQTHTHTHTQPFNGSLSRTTRVSQHQKGKPIWILLKQEAVSGSGISWTICKSAPRSRQITTPAPHHSVFYRPDALRAAQPTASKH